MSELSCCGLGGGYREGITKAQAGRAGLQCVQAPDSCVGSYKQGETPSRMQVHLKLVPGSRAEKASGAGSSSFHMDQFLHLGVSEGVGEFECPQPPQPSSLRAPACGDAARSGRPSPPPSLGAPTPTYGSDPFTLLPLRPRAPAVATVARDPARTPSLGSARVPPQPSRRRRHLAIPATVPAFFVARSYLPRLSRWAPPPGPHSTPRVSRAGLLPFFFRPRPAR